MYEEYCCYGVEYAGGGGERCCCCCVTDDVTDECMKSIVARVSKPFPTLRTVFPLAQTQTSLSFAVWRHVWRKREKISRQI